MKEFIIRSILEPLIGKKNLQFYDKTDWDNECNHFRKKDLRYPLYYTSKNFHGIPGGYLNAIAPITYDTVAALASPPDETWVRKQLIAKVQRLPQNILDIGCGTGSSSLMLKQTFPEAQVTGLDLSPYMLVFAADKARKSGLSIDWRHGLAESADFGDNQFDLITASFLFHETPPYISLLILQECFRILKSTGQILILDGNQKILRHADLLIWLFREPYSKVYAQENIERWLEFNCFHSIQTQHIGLIHQISSAIK